MINNTKPEVLAPAGSIESVYAAVRCGADGIYIGGKQFSARANAVNFSDDELKEAVRYCHLHGVKVYRAMNTVIFDSEAEEFCRQVRFSAEIGTDGLIIQDTGAAKLAEAVAPDMPRHSSTQMTIHTPLGAKAAEKLGFCRIVPARELSLEAITDICRTGVETEVFVHGAQCMCVSGQCYMSAMIGSRSANRGQCAQACRLPFSAKGKQEYYALSLKDMSLVEHIDKLTSAGCASFKIEGRMKRPEYVAAAVTALRHASDGESYAEDIPRLEAVFSRSGFTDGYLTNALGSGMFGSRRKEDVISADSVLPQLAQLYKNERKSGIMDFRFRAVADEPSELTFTVNDISGTVTGAVPEAARTRSLSVEDVQKQLSKLGGSRYEAGSIECTLSDGMIIPASELNRMRREAVSMADEMSVKQNTPVYRITDYTPSVPEAAVKTSVMKLRIRAHSPKAFSALSDMAELFILPADRCDRLEEKYIPMTAAELPTFVTDENKLYEHLETLCKKGFVHFICGNFTHLGVLHKLKESHEIKLHGGTGLNITNSFAVKSMAELGLEDITASVELKTGQFAALKKQIPTGFYAYGCFPLMTVRNCPVKAQTGCRNCTRSLTDRTGRVFPVKCYGSDYAEILNCEPVETSDRSGEFSGAAFALIDIGSMDTEEAVNTVKRYKTGARPEGQFTRGLYNRGIK